MIRKIKKIKATVLKTLELYPETRDDDMLLVRKIWEKQLLLPIESYTAKEFLDMMSNNVFANTESIRRSRQLIQSEGQFIGSRKEKKLLGEEMSLSINTLKATTCPICNSEHINFNGKNNECIVCFHKF